MTLARHILGVPAGSPGPDEIRDAWRRFARANHPDHCPGDPLAGARFAAGRDAYEVLRRRLAAEAGEAAGAGDGVHRAARPGGVVRRPHTGASPYAFPDLPAREWRA